MCVSPREQSVDDISRLYSVLLVFKVASDDARDLDVNVHDVPYEHLDDLVAVLLEVGLELLQVARLLSSLVGGVGSLDLTAALGDLAVELSRLLLPEFSTLGLCLSLD